MAGDVHTCSVAQVSPDRSQAELKWCPRPMGRGGVKPHVRLGRDSQTHLLVPSGPDKCRYTLSYFSAPNSNKKPQKV